MLNVLESSKLHNHNNLHPNSKHAGSRLQCTRRQGLNSPWLKQHLGRQPTVAAIWFQLKWDFCHGYEIFPRNWVVNSRIYTEQPRWFSMLKWSFLWLFCPLRYRNLKFNMVHWKRRCLPLTLIFRDSLSNFRGVSVSSPIANQSRCQKKRLHQQISKKKRTHTKSRTHTKKTSCFASRTFLTRHPFQRDPIFAQISGWNLLRFQGVPYKID